MNFDRWTFLKLIQLVFVIACLITKRATDVEASRLFLYLQKLSREWSLLNNVTWGSVGASFADATYGGYLIITSILFIARLCGEIPTYKRISEYLFLGLGAILYIILGALELFAIDDLPTNLVDNAIIIGTLSLITAGLFLLDMAGPKSIKPIKPAQFRNLQQQIDRRNSRELEISNNNQHVYRVEKQVEMPERELPEKVIIREIKEVHRNGGINGQNGTRDSYRNGITGGGSRMSTDQVDTAARVDPSRRRTGQDSPKRFGIFGKDVEDMENSDTDEIDDTIPPKMQQHSPVWSKIRKGRNLHTKFKSFFEWGS